MAFATSLGCGKARSRQCGGFAPRRRARSVCKAVLSEAATAATTAVLTSPGTVYPLWGLLKGAVIGPTVNEVAAALAGGTVGVMGTIIVLETGRQRARERKQCPYCRGTGKLPCGNCHTIGAIPAAGVPGAQKTCLKCRSGFLQCNHCEGEGRLIPIEYERAIRAQYEDYVYDTIADDYYQDGPPYV